MTTDTSEFYRPDSMTKTDWMRSIVESTKRLLSLGFDLFGDRQQAIQYAKDHGIAGATALATAINEMGWN